MHGLSQNSIPKLSDVTKVFTIPEEQFENTVKDLTGITLPPGPAKLLYNIQKTVESGGIPQPSEYLKRSNLLDSILSRIPSLPLIEDKTEEHTENKEDTVKQANQDITPEKPATRRGRIY